MSDSKSRNPRRFLEIACFNTASALIAASNGADRIEFCSGADVGGTTPLLSDLKVLKNQITRPLLINVMIRPRGGNFVYTREELEQMKKDIVDMSEDADGFVFGVLDNENKVDVSANRELLETVALRSRRKPCTFHRAFDETGDPFDAASRILELGFTAILTSGAQATAVNGVKLLKDLVAFNQESTVDVIVGGGVRSSNVIALAEETKAAWYHSSALVDETGTASANEVYALKKAIST